MFRVPPAPAPVPVPALGAHVPRAPVNIPFTKAELDHGAKSRHRQAALDPEPQGEVDGEVCFNTSMTGYQEVLTDPSYRGQFVTFTAPHIGNTGVCKLDHESHRIQAAGLIIRDLPLLVSATGVNKLEDYGEDIIKTENAFISEYASSTTCLMEYNPRGPPE